MYTDALLQFSSAQPIIGSASVLSTNTVDMLQNGNLGSGKPVDVLFQVNTALTGLTALEMQVITANDAALSSGVAVIGSTGAIPVASLTAGARFIAGVNPNCASNGARYIGARFVPTGTSTGGTVSAVIGDAVQDGAKTYASSMQVL